MKKRNKFNLKLTRTVIIFTVLVLFNLFIMNIAFVFGDSMKPTLKDWQVVLVYKIANEIKVGDIILTNQNNEYKTVLIKRVIAVAGQHLLIKDGSVYLDDKLLKEDYLFKEEVIKYSYEIDIIVPPDSFFVMGDNRNHSKDSRNIGCIKRKDIIGKVIWH